MGRKTAILLTLVVAFVAIAAPIIAVIHLAQEREVQGGIARSLAYASDVLERSEATADAFLKITDKLTVLTGDDPCGERGLQLMEYAVLASSTHNALGYMTDNHLVCSTLGSALDGYELGPADFGGAGDANVRIWTRVSFPLTGDIEFVVLERQGWVGIIHESVPLHIHSEGKDILLSVVSLENRLPLLSNGDIDPAWLETLPEPGGTAASTRDGYIVAIARSKHYDMAALAALPIRYLAQGADDLVFYLVPAGGVAGIGLGLVFLYFSRERLALPQVIKSALRRKEFFLVYQPIVELRSGRWVGAEALLRWQRPNREVVNPDIFMSVAEEAGMMPFITRRILECIAADVDGFFQEFPDFHLSINLTSGDIHQEQIVGRMQDLQVATGAGPGNFMIEVTERALATPEHARSVLHSLRDIGIMTAVDDFGTGYSSLSYLESFDLDILKIDKFFVETVNTQENDSTRKVMLHILDMARSLEMEVVAEGVETESQKQFLLEKGVQYAQGWLFGKPMKLSELRARLRSRAERKKHLALIE